ncbi:type II secretion system F family protein [Candidatus Woesearchaeota archaeon]|jgi:flagellar protein FlaJ|nr:type II secretion system F family protein [Candidatus Woesearchaeota archaeon]
MGARFYKRIAGKIPELGLKLQQAGMPDSEEEFVKKTMFSSFYLTTGIGVALALLLSKVDIGLVMLLIIFPVLFIMMFFYFVKFPDVKILRIQREIDKEIVYAGRYLVIELESGIPVYDAFKHVANNYPVIGKYFKNIIDDIDMGTTVDTALNRAVELTPSKNFRRVLWQIINSLTTGADVATSLNSVIEQVVREQRIELSEYGRKLNPLAMFYMIIAVILPSIGITMFVIFVSFLSIKLTLSTLLMIAGFMGFVQFLFYSVVKSSRPAGQFED